MALDLLRHVSYCFDLSSVIEGDGNKVRVMAEGVVLVDEIDSHLHPIWQRTIGNWLHSRFPNIQFIVATHSPLIPARVSLDHGMVIRLVARKHRGKSVVRPETDQGIGGLTADQNLTGPNFQMRSTRDVLTEELLKEIHLLRQRARARKLPGSDRQRLRQLELDFNKLAPAGADFIAAKKWIQRTAAATTREEELASNGASKAQG
jgi:hypothetical protein